jgi:hypothetical protein
MSNFKKGDRVERFKNGTNEGMEEGDTGVIDEDGSNNVILDKNGKLSKNHDSYNLRLIYSSNNNFMANSLKEKFALTFKKEPEKSFNKVGITDANDILTAEGKDIFLAWLLKKNGNDFKAEVIDPILKDEEKTAK